MLDDFKEEQNIAYKILTNSIKNNKISHAYLIEKNNYFNAIAFTNSFVKALLCPKKYINTNNCGNCTQCQKIDHYNFPEVKIIKPDGLWIKKDQLQQLQQEFSTKAVESKYKIYLIYNAEKLNLSAANSILKFLEEPENNIIAILLTDNIYEMLSTIISRCQVISLKSNRKNDKFDSVITELIQNTETIEDFKKDELKLSLIDYSIKFIINYEKNRKEVLLNMQSLWHDHFNEKEKIIIGFKVMILFYKEILNYKLLNNIDIFNDYIEDIKYISLKNDVNEISRKIDIIMDLKEKIYYNINNQLLMDKLVIRWEGE